MRKNLNTEQLLRMKHCHVRIINIYKTKGKTFENNKACMFTNLGTYNVNKKRESKKLPSI